MSHPLFSSWMPRTSWGRRALACAMLGLLASCGGGGGGSSASAVSVPTLTGANVQAVQVGPGPAGLTVRVANLLYTSVRLCLPGTATCQTIDHVLVDTGSTGLRLLKSAVNLALPGAQVGGQALYNCVQFIDNSYMWGPVAIADVYLGDAALNGKKAASLRVQLAGAPGSPSAPSACASGGFSPNHTIDDLGANGILGVGTDREDCGDLCVTNPDNAYYHVQSGATTVGTTVALNEQLQHPVSQFSTDNNGVIITLPQVATNGSSVASGYLIFGIGTASNNQPDSEVRAMALTDGRYFSTTFRGRTLSRGFVDSGSNGWFFNVPGSLSYPACDLASQWYCPTSTLAEQAIASSGTQTRTIDFSVANAQKLFNNTAAYAYDNLAGAIGDDDVFDFGLPFFYGRTVYTAIDGAAVTGFGTGPFVAF